MSDLVIFNPPQIDPPNYYGDQSWVLELTSVVTKDLGLACRVVEAFDELLQTINSRSVEEAVYWVNGYYLSSNPLSLFGNEFLLAKGRYFVGSHPRGLRLMDKSFHAEAVNSALGVRTPGRFSYANDLVGKAKQKLVVKNPVGSESQDIFLIKNQRELDSAYEYFASRPLPRPVIEEFVSGFEVTTTVLRQKKRLLFSHCRINKSGELLSHAAKKRGIADSLTLFDEMEIMKPIEAALTELILANDIYGISRYDFVVVNSGDPFLIDINLLPGLRFSGPARSVAPEAMKLRYGMQYPELLDLIIKSARIY